MNEDPDFDDGYFTAKEQWLADEEALYKKILKKQVLWNESYSEVVKKIYLEHGPGDAYFKPEDSDEWQDLGAVTPIPVDHAVAVDSVWAMDSTTKTELDDFIKKYSEAVAQQKLFSEYYHYPQKYIMGGFPPGANAAPLTTQPYSGGGEQLSREIRDGIPALEEYVTCPDVPTGCTRESNVWYMIQHLNDVHHWDREGIADWLESLDVDLAFPTPENIPKEPGEK